MKFLIYSHSSFLVKLRAACLHFSVLLKLIYVLVLRLKLKLTMAYFPRKLTQWYLFKKSIFFKLNMIGHVALWLKSSTSTCLLPILYENKGIERKQCAKNEDNTITNNKGKFYWNNFDQTSNTKETKSLNMICMILRVTKVNRKWISFTNARENSTERQRWNASGWTTLIEHPTNTIRRIC